MTDKDLWRGTSAYLTSLRMMTERTPNNTAQRLFAACAAAVLADELEAALLADGLPADEIKKALARARAEAKTVKGP